MVTLSVTEAIRRLAERPGSTGIFTDFDGTLSPTVPDPESARPAEGAVEALSRLAGVFGEVAVVSGRPARWLAGRLAPEGVAPGNGAPGESGETGAPGGGVELFGLHGLERWTGTTAEPIEAALAFTGAVSTARTEALAAGIEGLFVEDKTFGLTLHWRRARDPGATSQLVMALADDLAASTGLVLRPGKASVELVLPIGINKGTVVRERAAELRAVAYLGDDVSDALAFDALDDLAAGGATVVRIAVGGSEAPAALIERADLVLSGPSESVRFLEALADASGPAL